MLSISIVTNVGKSWQVYKPVRQVVDLKGKPQKKGFIISEEISENQELCI